MEKGPGPKLDGTGGSRRIGPWKQGDFILAEMLPLLSPTTTRGNAGDDPRVSANWQEAGKLLRTLGKGRMAQWQETFYLLTHRRKEPAIFHPQESTRASTDDSLIP